ncbi:MBL fold metallo-hydrolase [Roseiarcaceae bacterium H3SJ34-1]|uniref:MBL fold metallo-hydrolase n=1 Tax=Terripilifer ovatus TaxID=3032367 RepID=UPI003AB94FA1|nr:MBL fold metallo-hydrolase [Roseiarcaceae bacterium H3SJ34-1]
MLQTRHLKHAVLHQIAEFSGPTHDAAWMLPDMAPQAYSEAADWLAPRYWLPQTNRLIFTMQTFVIKTDAEIILIDTGVGNHKERLAPSQSHLNTPFLDWLSGIGCPPERVTHVALTHLHGDHVGWNTQVVDGRLEPTFPNATYYVPLDDWRIFSERRAMDDLAHHTIPFDDSVRPVVEAGLAKFISPGASIADILTALPAPGHSPGQLAYQLRDGNERLLFAADVLHSPLQVLHPEVNSRWCEIPDLARRSRFDLLSRAAQENFTWLSAHAFGLDGWQIHRSHEGFTVETSPPRQRLPDAIAV